jgi:flagellar hook-basal body complex protein FliE
MIQALPAIGSVVAGFAADQISQALQPAPAPGADFSGVLAGVGDTIDRLKAAEATSISAIEGRASTQEVVESVVAAEQSLHTALAVRDKVVSAYQALAQMSI